MKKEQSKEQVDLTGETQTIVYKMGERKR